MWILFFGRTESFRFRSLPRDIRGWSSPSAFLRTALLASDYVCRRGSQWVKYPPSPLLLLSPSFGQCPSRILDRNLLFLHLLRSRATPDGDVPSRPIGLQGPSTVASFRQRNQVLFQDDMGHGKSWSRNQSPRKWMRNSQKNRKWGFYIEDPMDASHHIPGKSWGRWDKEREPLVLRPLSPSRCSAGSVLDWDWTRSHPLPLQYHIT